MLTDIKRKLGRDIFLDKNKARLICAIKDLMPRNRYAEKELLLFLIDKDLHKMDYAGKIILPTYNFSKEAIGNFVIKAKTLIGSGAFLIIVQGGYR